MADGKPITPVTYPRTKLPASGMVYEAFNIVRDMVRAVEPESGDFTIFFNENIQHLDVLSEMPREEAAAAEHGALFGLCHVAEQAMAQAAGVNAIAPIVKLHDVFRRYGAIALLKSFHAQSEDDPGQPAAHKTFQAAMIVNVARMLKNDSFIVPRDRETKKVMRDVMDKIAEDLKPGAIPDTLHALMKNSLDELGPAG